MRGRIQAALRVYNAKVKRDLKSRQAKARLAASTIATKQRATKRRRSDDDEVSPCQEAIPADDNLRAVRGRRNPMYPAPRFHSFPIVSDKP